MRGKCIFGIFEHQEKNLKSSKTFFEKRTKR